MDAGTASIPAQVKQRSDAGLGSGPSVATEGNYSDDSADQIVFGNKFVIKHFDATLQPANALR